LVGASRLRHYLRDQILSRFFQSARSFSGLGIAHDDAVRRIRSFADDARERQGFRISPVGMPVVTLQKNGPVGENLVEIFLVWQGLWTKHRIIPAEIGRASCRERGYISERRGAVKRKRVERP